MPRPAFFLLLAVLAGSLLTAGCDSAGPPPPVLPAAGYTTQPAQVYIDGDTSDWASLAVQHADPSGGGLNIQRVWMAHSAKQLFLRVALNRPVDLQAENTLTLYLDTDDNPATGLSALGLGAEVRWSFGDRTGRYYADGDSSQIGHAALGLTALPTVRSSTFELALDRSAMPGGEPLVAGDSLRVAWSTAGDRLPDAAGGLGYALSETDLAASGPALSGSGSALRLLSYNVQQDALFAPSRQPHYRRILQALRPDVIGLQEVYEHTASETGDVVDRLLDTDDWSWAKMGSDLVVGSRFPIIDTHTIPGYESVRSGAALLDTRDVLDTPVLIIIMHPPCCNAPARGDTPSRDRQRQQVVDEVVAFIRAVKAGRAPIEVPAETPIVVAGDMNFVGAPQQPRTLRTGDIADNGRFGPDIAPDWDGSSLLDVNPRQTDAPSHATWINPGSSFAPGRLDYAYVTDSVLDVDHAFLLNSATLAGPERQTAGLESSDTQTASDHLPVVVDVSAR
jgi:endonuclease/exonuclease/phosphatase family metal-dependent hydrolase